MFKREVGTLGDGGALTLLPRILNHQTNAYGLLNTSAYLLYAKPDGEGKGNITGREGSLSGGGTFTIVSADFWNVKNGSNYYLQAMDPYTYQDFFVGPYTMVRKSTDYGPSGRSVANAMGIEEPAGRNCRYHAPRREGSLPGRRVTRGRLHGGTSRKDVSRQAPRRKKRRGADLRSAPSPYPSATLSIEEIVVLGDPGAP